MRAAAAILTLSLLGACAATGPSRFQADYHRLLQRCEAQGGVLTPTGATTGRPETENACRITGGASRIER
ncbi:MAG: hypothetical protein KY446_09435 [Proteobacteria bacterium]|nr:hypothetical protein [Pseudomonadota bacterium]